LFEVKVIVDYLSPFGHNGLFNCAYTQMLYLSKGLVNIYLNIDIFDLSFFIQLKKNCKKNPQTTLRTVNLNSSISKLLKLKLKNSV